jgi:L-threonylcarbamoyladenylate synthase
LTRAADHDWATEVLPAFEPGAAEGALRVPGERALASASDWLQRGVPVVIPTETVYGLAAPALDRQAVSAIFAIKQRPLDNPLIAHVSGLEQLGLLGIELSPLAQRLASAFWPGPLTLVLPTKKQMPWVTAGLDSIAVRQPRHDFACALIERVGPLAAPSANRSGLPSPTRASHALQDLQGRVPLIVDAGELEHGVESTVLDVRGTEPVLLRPGALSTEAIEASCGCAVRLTPAGSAARSPGMKYRHYSPRAELWLYPPLSGNARAARQLAADASALRAQGRRVAAIVREPVPGVERVIALPAEPRQVARQLFHWLRELDDQGMDCVLVESVAAQGVGRAIMDRLLRAATHVRRVEAALTLPEGP